MIDKTNYPISVLEDTQKLLQEFYKLEIKHFGLLTFNFGGQHLVEIQDSKNIKYKYIVNTPQQDSAKNTYYNYVRIPKDIHSNIAKDGTVASKDVIGSFNTWFNLVVRFHSVSLDRNEDFLNQYTEEFFAEFDIDNGDANLEVLPNEKQLKLFSAIEELQNKLLPYIETDPRVKEIHDDAQIIKDNIQNLSRGILGKSIARLQAKAKKIGIKFFKDVVDVAYKETIKFALTNGANTIQNLIN